VTRHTNGRCTTYWKKTVAVSWPAVAETSNGGVGEPRGVSGDDSSDCDPMPKAVTAATGVCRDAYCS
jgi:hypothetical protein